MYIDIYLKSILVMICRPKIMLSRARLEHFIKVFGLRYIILNGMLSEAKVWL